MKQILMTLALLCAATCAFSQDVIVKKDGSTIVSKVLKITSTEVEYKKFSNLEGPTYTILKSEVQVINYENGEKETFESTSQQTEEQPLLSSPYQLNGQIQSNDRDLLRMVGGSNPLEKSKRLKKAGWIGGGTLFAGGAICFIVCAANVDRDEDAAYFSALAGSAFVASSIIWTSSFLIAAHKAKMNSIYQVHNAPIYQQKIQLSNGSSLATGVDFIQDNARRNPTLGLGLRYAF